MKKTYMKPLTEAREMEMESMLCGSGTYSETIDKTNTIKTSDGILSKENNYDLWDMNED